jgi:hypothetical protein
VEFIRILDFIVLFMAGLDFNWSIRVNVSEKKEQSTSSFPNLKLPEKI